MAFFGVTNLGYQNPIGDKMLVNPRGASLPQDVGIINKIRLDSSLPEKQGPQPAPISSDIHQGSQERYREMVKRLQTPQAPDQLYITPLTDNQQYGWMSSGSPELWTRVKRFPRKNSEMTKFVKEMSKIDPKACLF